MISASGAPLGTGHLKTGWTKGNPSGDERNRCFFPAGITIWDEDRAERKEVINGWYDIEWRVTHTRLTALGGGEIFVRRLDTGEVKEVFSPETFVRNNSQNKWFEVPRSQYLAFADERWRHVWPGISEDVAFNAGSPGDGFYFSITSAGLSIRAHLSEFSQLTDPYFGTWPYPLVENILPPTVSNAGLHIGVPAAYAERGVIWPKIYFGFVGSGAPGIFEYTTCAWPDAYNDPAVHVLDAKLVLDVFGLARVPMYCIVRGRPELPCEWLTRDEEGGEFKPLVDGAIHLRATRWYEFKDDGGKALYDVLTGEPL